MSSSSDGSAPRTSLAAWRIEARMIAPESITVPSRSKRTTGKRMLSMLARPSAQPHGPWLDALDLQDPVGPGIVSETSAKVRFVLDVADQQRVIAVACSDRPT